MTARSTVPALALVLLVALAGCGAPATGGTRTPTATPAPVPGGTDRGGADVGLLAPGLAPSGVTDAGRLASAHARRLAGTSYAVRSVVTRREANGSLVVRYERVIRFAADKRRFRYDLDVERPGGTSHVQQWADGRRVFRATTGPNGTSYRLIRDRDGTLRDPAGVFPANASNRADLARLFALVNTTVTDRRVRDGRTQYRVSTAGGRTDLPPLRNLSVVAWVDGSGLVREYHVAYDVGHAGPPTRVTVDVRYGAVGTTTVDRPAWVREARDATRNASSAR